MHLVLTNDDGYDAPGLAALWEAVRMLGFTDVRTIAPRVPHSAKGHTVSDEVRVQRKHVAPMGEILIVDGTPADCVNVALYLEGLPRPDWLLAGINRGGNLGVDQYNSGTVAAARQAAILGIPAVAVSQLVRAALPDDWLLATRQTAAVLAALLLSNQCVPAGIDSQVHTAAQRAASDLTRQREFNRSFWNVNLPKPPAGQPTAGVLAVSPSNDPSRSEFESAPDPHGGITLRYTGAYLNRPAVPGTDVHAVFNHFISLSLLPK